MNSHIPAPAASDFRLPSRSRFPALLCMICVLFSLASCAAPGIAPMHGGEAVHGVQPATVVTRIPFADRADCADTFVRHALDSVSLIPGEMGVYMFDSNGSGVALGDLDRDLLPEIILANLSEPNVVLWNQGGLQFRRTELADMDSRGAATVDIDGDGLLDIVFTRRLEPPIAYLSQANALATQTSAFSRTVLPGIAKLAYSMAWTDTDADGDLDLLTGSYDLELQALLGEGFEGQTDSGVYWHEYRDGRFHSRMLARRSQALALAALPAPEGAVVVAGNDFLLADGAWKWRSEGWHDSVPFEHTTQNTMSYSVGDVNNDGHLDLFAADMKPRTDDPAVQAAWAPVMAKVLEDPTDRQITENVLQVQDREGGFANAAPVAGIAATGWTWSSQLADFDQDGFLDLYVVNGMNAVELFSHLPDNELVETNWAFRNDQGRGFVPAPEWNMGLREGGRGMTVGDVDFDGDLDVVVSNLLSPAVLLENRLCQGASIQIRLRDRYAHNTHGVGAQLVLHTDRGSQLRLLEVTGGYLSGLPPVVHFGFPAQSELRQLEILWPDGESQTLRNLEPNHLYTIVRTD